MPASSNPTPSSKNCVRTGSAVVKLANGAFFFVVFLLWQAWEKEQAPLAPITTANPLAQGDGEPGVADIPVVDSIAAVATGNRAGHQDVPLDPVTIQEVSIDE